MLYSQSFLEELISRNDIVEVVSEYVRLDKRSGANLFGLCPFHGEKTPSFSVSPGKQIYHCFGCGKGGGVINFIMEIENLRYPEAVEFLAKRVNMPLPERTETPESRRRQRMLTLNRDAARFFYEKLQAPEGAPAREYMNQRRIGRKTAMNFGIGYAPDSWNALLSAMRAKGYSDQELADAKLVRAGKNGGFYDTFRSRLMFPVVDLKGDVIGFSGRIIGEGEPKYMNSPETLVFEKGRNLFGMNLARKSKAGYIILVEGNVDVVSLHQAGFDSAVASLGTALTSEQAQILSRYTERVILCYDSDSAGAKATERALNILNRLNLNVSVLRVPGAKDPDEFIKLRGADAFQNLVDSSEKQFDYRLARIKDKYTNLEDSGQKLDFVKEAVAMIAREPDQLTRTVYVQKIAAEMSLPESAIQSAVDDKRKQLLNSQRKKEQKEAVGAVRNGGSAVSGIRYENAASAKAEEGIIRLLYLEPGIAREIELPSPEEFTSGDLAKIYGTMLTRIRDGEDLSLAALGGELNPNEISLLIALQNEPEDLSSSHSAMEDYIRHLRRQKPVPSADGLRQYAESKRQSGKGYKEK